MCCSVMDGMWGENKQMKQSGGISTVYGVAGRRRRRRCSSATRVSLVTSERRTAVKGTAAAAVSRYINEKNR